MAEQTTQANITKKALSLSSISASNKIYDGNKIAKVSARLEGLISGDDVSKSISSTFNDKNVGESKIITINDISLLGSDAKNYSITTKQTTKANITKKALSLGDITAKNKIYDGNKIASVNARLERPYKW